MKKQFQNVLVAVEIDDFYIKCYKKCYFGAII